MEAALSPTHTGPAPNVVQLKLTPLSAEGFAAYGQVIEFPHTTDAMGISANHGTARRVNHTANLSNLRPVSSTTSLAAQANLALFRCVPPASMAPDATHHSVYILERHQWSTQAFIPIASTPEPTSSNYLVVVALNGPGKLIELL
ncbi:ureidoglycolate hydrolase [Syncephalis fuscata]|nr:ureidoglycolate hydrolase [Syncephalis fuscata]